ncbi:secretion/DNA translocation related CpaE-like protein [Rhodococcus sp. 27YEA15]|uniref:septum site-determining protein Ssd n=1 Tax=Rhodococcus sp. 27YEA15 TaxID=3156259 RepID=UPI003C7C023E
MNTSRAPGADVLVLVDDPLVLASVRRVAAAVDFSVDEVDHPVARQRWNQASAIVLDSSAAEFSSSRFPRRPRMFVVCEGEPTVDDWKSATALGAERVVSLPANENELVTLLGTRVETGRRGTVLSVVGGCGGAGASVCAAAIALTSASRQIETLLVDIDPFGSGADVLLGMESAPGPRWGALTIERGRLSPDSLRDALPSRGNFLRVLASSRSETEGPTTAAAGAVVEAGSSSGGLVICDVPRQRSSVGETVLGLSDFVLVVVPATVAACVAAEKIGAWVSRNNSKTGILVRGPAPGGLRGIDVADMLGLPLVAVMRGRRNLGAMLERGGLQLARGCPLRTAAAEVLDAVEAAA